MFAKFGTTAVTGDDPHAAGDGPRPLRVGSALTPQIRLRTDCRSTDQIITQLGIARRGRQGSAGRTRRVEAVRANRWPRSRDDSLMRPGGCGFIKDRSFGQAAVTIWFLAGPRRRIIPGGRGVGQTACVCADAVRYGHCARLSRGCPGLRKVSCRIAPVTQATGNAPPGHPGRGGTAGGAQHPCRRDVTHENREVPTPGIKTELPCNTGPGVAAGAAIARRRGLDGHPPAAPAPPPPPSPRSAPRGRPGLAARMTAGGSHATLCLHCVRGGGAVDDRARRRDRSRHGGPRPAASVPRLARAGDRGAQGRVRAGPAGQGRVRCAGGSGARVADLRGAGCGHRRHSRRADRSPAAGQTRPGPATGEHRGQGGGSPGHCDNRVYGRLVGRVVRHRR